MMSTFEKYMFNDGIYDILNIFFGISKVKYCKINIIFYCRERRVIMNFCDRLRVLRKERGLTQDQLAIKTNISQTAISNWEAGNRSPSIEYVITLANYFQVSLDYICGLEDD